MNQPAEQDPLPKAGITQKSA